MQKLGYARLILVIAGIPDTRQESPHTVYRMNAVAEELMLLAALGIGTVPDRRHALAIEQHHRSLSLGNAQLAAALHVHIEKLGRIGKIDLVDIVVDRTTLFARQLGNRIAIIGKARLPPGAIETL